MKYVMCPVCKKRMKKVGDKYWSNSTTVSTDGVWRCFNCGHVQFGTN